MQKRRVPINMARTEGFELGENAVIPRKDTREVHQLGQANDLRMFSVRCEVGRFQLRAGCFHHGRGHAGRQGDAQIHQRAARPFERVIETCRTEHVGDLVRIPHGGGHAVRQDAAIELGGTDERGFDVAMRVDQAGRDVAPGRVDLLHPAIVTAHADNAIPDHRDVAVNHALAHDVQGSSIADHEVRFAPTQGRVDTTGKDSAARHSIRLTEACPARRARRAWKFWREACACGTGARLPPLPAVVALARRSCRRATRCATRRQRRPHGCS